MPSFRGMRSMSPESRDSGSGPSGHPGMTVVLMRQDLRQEFLRAVAARAAEEIGLERIFDDFALVHEDDAMRDFAGEAHFMGHDHHGHALAGVVDHDVEHF